MTNFVLVNFDCNYADEFDVNGSLILARADWEAHVQQANAFDDWPIEKYFGTNEYLEFENARDYLGCFDVCDLTDDEAAVLQKFFPRGVGTVEMIYFQDYESWDEDDE